MTTKTILVAEDDDINFYLINEWFCNSRFKIIRATNGIEAVDACTNNNIIDLVLMDIKMPGLNGYDAIIQIKNIKPQLPIIAQTAFAMHDEKELIMQAGANGYLTKPLKYPDLIEEINKYLPDNQ